MGEQKVKAENKPQLIFERKNYTWMLIGLAFIAIGFLLMMGGGSEDPQVFNFEIYSWRRIRLAPALILIGMAIEVYAILVTSKSHSNAAFSGNEFDQKNAAKAGGEPNPIKHTKK